MAANDTSAGWIKLHRQFLRWEWYDIPEMARLFIHLLLSVNYEDRQWHGMTIKAGSMVTSRAKLAKEVGISEQTLRTCLERLKSTKEVTIETTHRYHIITISKYADYQIKNVDANPNTNPISNQQTTNDQPATNQPLTTTKEINNIINNNDVVVDARTREMERFDEFFSEGNRANLESFLMAMRRVNPNTKTIDDLKGYAMEAINEWLLCKKPFNESPSDWSKHLMATIRIKNADAAKTAAAARGREAKSPRSVNDRWVGFELPPGCR